MKILKELVNNLSGIIPDYEIIKMYFIENNIEESAVQMLTELSSTTINKQREYNFRLKEYFLYMMVFLDNKNISLEVRKSLMYLYNYFLQQGELNEVQLNEVKSIFENLDEQNLRCFPQLFLGYLQSKGIGTQFNSAQSFRSNIIEKGGK